MDIKDYEVEGTLTCAECGSYIQNGGAIVLDHDLGEAIPLCVKHFKEAITSADTAYEMWVCWGWAMKVI